LGEALGNLAAPGWVVLLIGPLGAGKTVFARGLLRGAGVTGRVRSPTFTLLNEYRGKIEAWHADLYRLVGDAEFIAIGGDEVLLARDGLVIVEWAERLGGLAPPRRIQVEMSFPPGAGSDNGRNLHMDLAGEAYRDAAAVLASWPGAREGAPAR
jgi:tRNA threonylcarbamoyladenosine biosynthesis protein TsaE